MADPMYQTRGRTITRTAEIDEGLRAYMNKIYALMAGAMIITGLVAYVFGQDLKIVTDAVVRAQSLDAAAGADTTLIPGGLLATLFFSPLKWVVMLAPLAFVFGLSAGMNRLAASTAQTLFWVFAAVMGLSLSTIFVEFTGMSIARVFFITAIAFGSLSLYGYTTNRDISGWGAFLIMGVVGLIVAMIANIFIASSALQMAISVVGVLIFAGLTAYDTQQLKNMYLQLRGSAGGEAFLEKGAVMGALRLYLDFLNMFIMLLHLFGQRE